MVLAATGNGTGNGAVGINEAGGASWTCDRCGTENGARKVRCNGCPRWRDGKRPAFKKKATGQSVPPLAADAIDECSVGDRFTTVFT